ncbi:hypothetical protein [Roseomonas sp. 18066]|uniref:hypothetical protein n=1 Tax=Roseomonas sp. 18066 TaxID=2681412 RepID=UPI00135A0384|nr:hypothetical protein [Roseomonas sp. 18066]
MIRPPMVGISHDAPPPVVCPTRWECARAYIRTGSLPPRSMVSLALLSWSLAGTAAGLFVGLLLEGMNQ